MSASEQKKVMYGVFMFMMNNGYFVNQKMMATALKSVIHILGNAHGLSKTEQDNCLVYFFEEYAKGCSQPMPESYIRSSLIPIVHNWGTIDITVGTDILDAVFDII